jgi:hypothetical protein
MKIIIDFLKNKNKRMMKNIIKETVDNYINKHLIKEYNATADVKYMFQTALENLYHAYNAMIQDVNTKHTSKNEFIIKQIEKDIRQLDKDIKYIH